jgi:hypothetical protein
LPLEPEAKQALSAGFERAGIEGAIRAGLELGRLETGRDCTGDPRGAALLLARLGEADWMFACLREAAEGCSHAEPSFVMELKADPVYATYRSDPRFAEVLRAIGLEY